MIKILIREAGHTAEMYVNPKAIASVIVRPGSKVATIRFVCGWVTVAEDATELFDYLRKSRAKKRD